MTLDFTAYPNVDDATKERTENFFWNILKTNVSDAERVGLIQQGICLEARDTSGNTALTLAAEHEKTKVVQTLLAAGATTKARNHEGYTALIRSARNGDTDTVKVLLAGGADIDAIRHNGYTALIEAAAQGKILTVKALLAAGANIEARDVVGWTALTRAVNEGHIAAANALVEAGANIGAQNSSGLTPLMFARARSQKMAMSLDPTRSQQSYDRFLANATPPKSTEELYSLLTVSPVIDSESSVDYVGNIQKIFAHAHWVDKEQATDMMTQLQRDGRINAQAADAILSNNFPEPLHAARLQRHNPGMVL